MIKSSAYRSSIKAHKPRYFNFISNNPLRKPFKIDFNQQPQPPGDTNNVIKWFHFCDDYVIYEYYYDEAPSMLSENFDKYCLGRNSESFNIRKILNR